jgi:antagonist of KipI
VVTTVEVLTPGMQTTVQDLGRPGYGHLGVSASGAADPLALRLGNLVAGNCEGAAALEMTLLGGRFRFHGPALCVLAGADFTAALDGVPVELWTPTYVRAGQTLGFGGTRGGARCYLCFGGGESGELLHPRSQRNWWKAVAQGRRAYRSRNGGQSGAPIHPPRRSGETPRSE